MQTVNRCVVNFPEAEDFLQVFVVVLEPMFDGSLSG
jgi:hypothetical protein